MKHLLLLLIAPVLFIDVSRAQVIRTIAGNGAAGYSGDGGPARQAAFGNGYMIAADHAGNIYIPDMARVRKINTAGIITTIAGNGTRGFSGDGGPAANALVGDVTALTVDPYGNLYLYDEGRIRKISTAGIITTVAGNGIFNGPPGNGGPALAASFANVQGLAVDAAGNIFTADNLTYQLRKIDAATGIVNVYAAAANIIAPAGLHIDAGGNLLVCDMGNLRILRITPSGSFSPVAGSGVSGFSGDGGPATSATMNLFIPMVVTDGAGNMYISDYNNHRVRKVNAAGIISTVAGNGTPGLSGDGWSPACAATDCWGLAMMPNGDLLISEINHYSIRRIYMDSTAPVHPGPISGSMTFCPGAVLTYSIDSIPNASGYVWTLPPGWTGSSTTHTITVVAGSSPGSITVSFRSPCGLSPARTLAVTNAAVLPAISIATEANGLCSGNRDTSIFVATIVNGGTSPIYRWEKNGMPVGSNAGIYKDPAPAAGDVIIAYLTSNAACAAPPTVSSNAITLQGGTPVVPGININTIPPTRLCAGTPLNFIANINGGGAAPQYQWYKNGIPIPGAVGSTYLDGVLADRDTLSVLLTSSEVCATPRTMLSNKVGVRVEQIVVPRIAIAAAPSTTVVAGQTVTFSAVISGGGQTPGLQWKKNGIVIPGATGMTYATNMLRQGDRITAELTSTEFCASPAIVSAAPLTMQVATGVAGPGNGTAAVSLFPNPNNGAFSLSVAGHTGSYPLRLEVVNAVGQRVQVQQLVPGAQQRVIPVVLPAQIVPGVYWLRAVMPDGSAVVKPFSLQR